MRIVETWVGFQVCLCCFSCVLEMRIAWTGSFLLVRDAGCSAWRWWRGLACSARVSGCGLDVLHRCSWFRAAFCPCPRQHRGRAACLLAVVLNTHGPGLRCQLLVRRQRRRSKKYVNIASEIFFFMYICTPKACDIVQTLTVCAKKGVRALNRSGDCRQPGTVLIQHCMRRSFPRLDIV